MCPPRPRRAAIILAGVLSAVASPAHAQSPQATVTLPSIGNPLGAGLRRNANGVLSLLSYSVLPGAAASSVQLQTSSTGNPALTLGRFGDGTTLSDDLPLYVEGFVGYSRYNPRYVFGETGSLTRTLVGGNWNSLATNVGVGWDFKLTDHWVLRPILTASAGLVASDAALAGIYLRYKYNVNLAFLHHGVLNAAGGGGSLVLAYYLKRPDYELDFEARSTNAYLQTFGGTSAAVRGSAVSNAMSTWARLRWPAGVDMLGRPLRYVIDQQNSWFFDESAKSLGFAALHSIGGGLELDTGAHEIGAFGFNVQRLRVVARYFFGPHVSGYSVGLGVSF